MTTHDVTFIWQNDLVIDLVAHFLPPPVGSAIVMARVDLEPHKNSALGPTSSAT
jgi:hypothetical protein